MQVDKKDKDCCSAYEKNELVIYCDVLLTLKYI